MSRSSNSFLLRSGLVIATMLAIVPTSVHAETTTVRGQDAAPQTSTTVTPQTTPAPSAAKATGGSQSETQSKPGTEVAPVPATTATGSKATPTAKSGTNPTTTPTAKSGTPLAPATTATGGTTPTAKPGTTPAPATTATGTKPAEGSNVTPQKQPASAVSTNSPPVMDTVNLVLNLKEKQVYVYKGDKILTKYPVAIGKKGWETPTGDWYVMEKVVNPGWTSFKDGSVMKPGKNNPLGERWIGFWTDGKDVIGFHGTPNLKSIGTAASHGCVRMHNKDVKALFPLVKVGTTVKVIAQ
jgi:lipoprotein-anchoring transpeptidase ErfK/SrfK